MTFSGGLDTLDFVVEGPKGSLRIPELLRTGTSFATATIGVSR